MILGNTSFRIKQPKPKCAESAYMLSKNENYGMIDSFGKRDKVKFRFDNDTRFVK